MNLIDKIKGKTSYALAKFFEVLFDILLWVSQLAIAIAKGFFGLAGLILFLGPFALLFLFNPGFIIFLLLFAVIVFLGSKLVIQLKYLRYVFTEYFYDRADFYLKGKKVSYDSFAGYQNRYWQMEAERKREEQRRKQEEAERMFRDSFFGQWEEFTGGGYSQGNYSSGNQYGSSMFDGYSGGFKKQYEDSCDLLGVPYSANKNDIRTAYRQKAKQYHPDINKDEGATEMFQKINDANTFLSDENINKYKSIN